MIHVIVVDDHRLFRMGLMSTIKNNHPDICFSGDADSGEALFSLPALAHTDLVLLDINLPGMGGAAVARRLRSDYPAVKILAISAESSAETIQTMLEAGIDGFISKQHGEPDELANAIRTVMSGLEYFGQDVSKMIIGIYVAKKKTAAVTPEFTEREREIITLCRDGLIGKEVAARLGISVTTVNTHKGRIFQKLGINNTMEMVQYAMKKGIIMLLAWLMPCFASSQYVDHRNRGVDSLEQVLATNPPTGVELGQVYRNLMWGYSEINAEKSIDYALKCIEIAIPYDGWKAASDAYFMLGFHFENSSIYDSAMVYYNKALYAAERMKDFPKKYNQLAIDDYFSSMYATIGNLYQIQGKYHQAILFYQDAIRLFEKWNWKQSQALAYRNISTMYLSMGNYEQAEQNGIKADFFAHESADTLIYATVKQQFSCLYLETKDFDKALQNAQIAYDYFFSHPEEGIKKVQMLNILSKIYLEGFNNDRQAEEYARQALQLSDELGLPREKSSALATLSSIFFKRGEWRKAERTALEALATDDSEPSNTLSLYAILTKVNSKLGKSDKANEYFDKHHKLQSSWSNKNYQMAIREMEVKYETEKKELEIERQQHIISRRNFQNVLLTSGVTLCIVFLALLWYMLRLRTRSNKALTERNETLAEMNLTKDKFFNIISHDLKNPAEAQRDALQLLVKNARLWDIDTLTDYYSELLKSADGQVELLYNLLNWAQIQTGRMTYTPETFLLSALLPDISLIKKMAQNKGISFTTSIPNDALVTGDKKMVAVIVRNLLTNAVKFTSTSGEVSLTITPSLTTSPPLSNDPSNNRTYTVSVSDTGIGMNQEQINNLFCIDSPHSRIGTADEQGSGLGLIVCKEFLEKHGSELHVESEQGRGSRFWFTI